MIQLQDVNKIYGRLIRTFALRGVSLRIDAGEFAAVIGRSGSGKSTLLHILGALDRPTSGRMDVNGVDIFSLDEDSLASFRNRTIGFIFQFHHLLPEFSALENVLLPFRIGYGRVTAEAERRARELVDLVGVSARMNNRSTELSGGEQQRIAIARALANSPAIVLADEPTGNLDNENSEGILELLHRIGRESGTTFVIVTHDRHIAAACDRVIEIDDGMIKSDFLTSQSSPDENWERLAPCNCRERRRP